MSWGYHLLLEVAGTNSASTNPYEISKFINELVTSIEMKAVGEPTITYLQPDPVNSGYSVMQLIETSNITAHFVDSDNTAYFDVFSCKKFDPEIVEKVISKYFAPTAMSSTFLARQAPIK